jgi:DNA-binding NarL/FixJ family response regulator
MKSEYIINTIENILLEQQCFLSSLDVAILKEVLDGYSYSKIASRLSSSAGCIMNHAETI